MKKILMLLFCACIASLAMGQEVVNGVLQGSPKSFMFLPTSAPGGNWDNSWVKPKRYEDAHDFMTSSTISMGSGAQLGAITSGSSYSHRFVVTADSTQSPQNDACFRFNQSQNYQNRPILAEAWNTELYPGTFTDTVIQMGGPTGTTTRGKYAQEILYSFVPDTNNPVLLLQFAFVTENALHSTIAPRNPGVEFAVLAHGTPSYLPLGYYPGTDKPYSQFFFGTPLGEGSSGDDYRNTPSPVMPYIVPKGSCNCSKPDIYTFPYVIVAFDLSEQARNQQAVDFRVREWACDANVHWAYCYFTAKMIPAKLKVEYCEGSDTLKLNIPWGFRDDGFQYTYNWYNGADSANARWFDPNYDPENPLTLGGSSIYHPKLTPNPAKPYFRCEVESYTGVPFTYEATVNYYLLKPAFFAEPKAISDSVPRHKRTCKNEIVVHNHSLIGTIKPKYDEQTDTLMVDAYGTPLTDTIWQDLRLNDEQCSWNFGVDTTVWVHGFEPEVPVYPDTGKYVVKLHISDFQGFCTSYDTLDTVHLIKDYTTITDTLKDTVITCESKLPYHYMPARFGNNNPLTTWDINVAGTVRKVSFDGYNDTLIRPSTGLLDSIVPIVAWNGCDSIARVRFDVLTPKVVIQQEGDFCDSAQVTLVANVSNVQIDSVEYTWTFMDTVMSNINEMLAVSDGTYSVSIVDRSTECKAATSYKIEPCKPNVFLPNCITPSESKYNGPKQNDYFYLDQFVLRFITEVKFMVYARDGEQVFYYEGKKDNISGEFFPPTPYAVTDTEMENRLILWDGKVNDRVISGTYVYMLWVVSGGQTYLYKGSLKVL